MTKEALPADVQRLLVQRAGLRLSAADWAKAGRLLKSRAGRRHASLAEYCASLSANQLAREVESLAARLTPGETFFFRDHGQFDLLRCRLLPELIEARRSRRSLRLWSAGCASGEEAYSLAMLVDMVLPERAGWRISILGTDLNEEALARARGGRYGRWSFRLVPASLQQSYFRQEGEEWVLKERIRAMVSFQAGNLVAAPLPDPVCRDMDIILCRNVLIYFSPEASRSVAAKLAACLAEGGYLVCGHTELMGLEQPALRSRLFPEGVVYQRPAQAGGSAPDPAGAGPPPAPGTAGPPPPAAGAPLPASAQALADRGDYAGAETACRQATAADPTAPGPHFLLAQLAQLKGDYREAETELNRTLYLSPDFVAAYLELAALLERAGQEQRARSRRRTALHLLRRLPAEARVEPFEVSAGQLASWLEQTEAL